MTDYIRMNGIQINHVVILPLFSTNLVKILGLQNDIDFDDSFGPLHDIQPFGMDVDV